MSLSRLCASLFGSILSKNRAIRACDTIIWAVERAIQEEQCF